MIFSHLYFCINFVIKENDRRKKKIFSVQSCIMINLNLHRDPSSSISGSLACLETGRSTREGAYSPSPSSSSSSSSSQSNDLLLKIRHSPSNFLCQLLRFDNKVTVPLPDLLLITKAYGVLRSSLCSSILYQSFEFIGHDLE